MFCADNVNRQLIAVTELRRDLALPGGGDFGEVGAEEDS